MESLLRYSHLSPPHDRRPLVKQVRGRMAEIERAMAALDSEAQGEGWFALGRAHQLLGEDREGQDGLEKAWARGMRSPECAEALGLARAGAYLDALRNLQVDLSRAPHHPAVAELRRQFALPAAELLARGAKEKPDVARVLEALRADIEGRPADAERLASEALVAPAAQPWEVLPWRILAAYWEYKAQVCIGSGNMAFARSQLARAWSALERAQEAARSDPSLRLTEGWLCFTEAHILEMEGQVGAAEAMLDRAVAAFARARALQPDLMLARKFLLDGLRRRAALRRSHGLPAREALDRALAALREAEAEGPEEGGLRMARRRLYHEAMLVAWAAGAAVDGPEARRYRSDLPSGLPAAEAGFAIAQLDLEIAEELLRQKRDPRKFLDVSLGPLRASYQVNPQAPGRLEAWVDWFLADAEARRRRGQSEDPAALRAAIAEVELRIRKDGPHTAFRERLDALGRLRNRAPLKAPGGPGP